MNYSKKNKRLGIYSVIIIFTLFCLSCDKKEIYFFAQGNGPDLVFEIAPNDSALCYISFQSEPHRLSEVNKEEVSLNGKLDVSWKSRNMPLDVLLNLKVNEEQVVLKDTFSLTISTLIGNREQFFYYNDLLKNVPLYVANIKLSHKTTDSLFYVRATQQFTVSKISVVKPLSIDLSAVLENKNVSRKSNSIIEEREYHNPADFPGVK